MSRDLRNKVIVITGASAGIGAVTARRCAEAGMHVVLNARREDKLREVAQQIKASGGQACTIVGDVRSDEDMANLFQTAFDTYGRVDSVFANAGYGLFCKVTDTPDGLMRDIYETNFFGTVRTIKAAMPYLKQTPDGLRHILICTSSCSEIGLPMYGFYASTKAAQDSIAGAMRAELSVEDIHVSSVHPIGTATEFFEVAQGISPPSNNGFGLNTPAALIHDADVVARAVVKCLHRPKPEVWPGWLGRGTRLGLALVTAVPRLGAWTLRDMMRKRYHNHRPGK